MNAYKNEIIPAPKVTFHGAARTVTGSMHLVETGPHRILLDCGTARGNRDENRVNNRVFPFDPKSLTAVVISHAHTDHIGNLANLVAQGYTGPIYATPATRDLLELMLGDSARIQEDEANTAALMARQHPDRTYPDKRPLFTSEDVFHTASQTLPIQYGRPTSINGDLRLTFSDAGHILGSALVTLDVHQNGRDYRIVFTGDLGRRGLPFHGEPCHVPPADLVISESTYGGRFHDTLDVMAAKMGDIVRRTVERGGKVLVPAFSLGRTQLVLHYLKKWMLQGTIPRLPLYVDSPLAKEISHVYEDYPDAVRDEVREVEAEFMLSMEEARTRSRQQGPSIIVASGGMLEGGKILHHLKHHIDDPRSTLCLVSYQAPESLGAQMLLKQPTVRFHGRTWNKWIEVESLNGFSGHADQNDFRHLLAGAAGKTGKVRLVHGEPEAAEALATVLTEMGFPDVGVPGRGEAVAVG